MTYTWEKANVNAATRHTTRYFEMLGNRAIYNDGWLAAATPVCRPHSIRSTSKRIGRLPPARWNKILISARHRA
jgi:hypothetical protein